MSWVSKMNFSFGVFGNQLGVALGFLIPPLIITGPIKSFSGISDGKNGTFSGTFPGDWRNSSRWEVTEKATDEVTAQEMDKKQLNNYSAPKIQRNLKRKKFSQNY